MNIDLAKVSDEERYKLLSGAVLPRPIAWVGSVSVDGVDNLAPFSFFNVASSTPPVISISFSDKPDGGRKDSLNNILATEFFSVSIVSHNMRDVMHETGTAVASGVDEFSEFNIEKVKCNGIEAPKVKAAKVSLECKFRQLVEFGEGSNSQLLLADVLSLEVDDEIIDFPKINMVELDAVGRGSGAYYTTTRDTFSLIRK